MASNLDFSKVVNRYTFQLNFKLATPLHIGGNQEEAITADSGIVRDANGKPFIPGSSLKGLFRSASERALHLISDKDACFLNAACDPTKKFGKDALKKKDEKELFNTLYENVCPVCQTYGGGTIASKVKFQHIVFEESIESRVRTSNRIDRETGAAASQALFSYEYIQPKSELQLIIEAENMTDLNIKVLALAIAQFQQNMIRLGGKQAKGLGQIEAIDGTVLIQKFDEANKKEALAALLGMSQQPEPLSTFLQDVLTKEVS